MSNALDRTYAEVSGRLGPYDDEDRDRVKSLKREAGKDLLCG